MAKILDIPPERLRQIQLLQLTLLKEFDRICRKHHLTYTLCGGSLLGAIRHQGFIPWDDDIDVTMLREDYDSFCRLCATELDSKKIFLQTMDTDPEYRLSYGRLLLNGTAYVRAGQEHMKSKNGIFIDIFPRDGCSDSILLDYIQGRLALLMRKMLHSPVGAVKSSNRFCRIAYRFLRIFPRSFSSGLLHLIQFLNFHHKTTYVSCYGLMRGDQKKRLLMDSQEYRVYREILKNESTHEKNERKLRNKGIQRIFLEQVIDLPFEDMMAMVTVHYDTWLKLNYDDYMKLPPVHQRIMHQTVSHYSLGIYKE